MDWMDSKTYRAAVERGAALGGARGRVEEARRMLVRIAERRLGPVPATTHAILATIDDVEQLERLFDRLPEVKSWDELLAP